MNGRIISIIYFYLISAISIILLVIGTYNTITFIVNSTFYDKYPLPYTDQCEFYPAPEKTTPLPSGENPQIQTEQLKQQQDACQKRIEDERQKRKVEDIKNAITFLLIGGVLFGLHFPLALKRSNSDK